MSRSSLKIHSMPARLKAAGWDRLLKRWSALIAYATEEDDVPYWYGERSLTGLLAAAAWKLPRSWSLEEFTGRRGKRLRTKSGRGDLWVGLGKQAYTIEAKVKWPPSGSGYAVQYARGGLTEARKQLWKLSSQYRLGTLIAICYIVPCPTKNSPFAKSARVKEMIATVAQKFSGKRFIVASHFPGYELPEEDDRVYPGVILVGRVVSWG